jgi:hypothetical protein
MVLHTCERCLKQFNKKHTYDIHVNRKNPCKKQEREPTFLGENINDNAFSFLLNELKIVKDELSELKKLNSSDKIKKIEEENKELKKRIKKIEPCSITKITKQKNNMNNSYNTLSVNNSTTNNINVNLVAFGKEKMDFVVEDIVGLCQGNKTVPNFINFVHFDENKPQNHNVYMSNRKNRSEVFVYDGEDWMLTSKKNIVERLVDKGIMYVEGKLDELEKKLTESKLNAVRRAVDAYNDTEHENNKEITKKITGEVELILYNKKNVVINTKNKIESDII